MRLRDGGGSTCVSLNELAEKPEGGSRERLGPRTERGAYGRCERDDDGAWMT
jgi:hypothetical protein